MAKTCRHRDAFPTVFLNRFGFYWCPDCGAYRLVTVVKDTTLLKPAHKGWVRPIGREKVVALLERLDA